jgi:hypothetical protein
MREYCIKFEYILGAVEEVDYSQYQTGRVSSYNPQSGIFHHAGQTQSVDEQLRAVKQQLPQERFDLVPMADIRPGDTFLVSVVHMVRTSPCLLIKGLGS